MKRWPVGFAKVPRPLVGGLLLLLMFCLPGCPPKHAVVERPADMPTYSDLAQRYNANIAGLDSLWSRAIVELTWRDGKRDRHEQGEGHLILMNPGRASLSVGKLGVDYLYVGCNEERYWLFDLEGDKIAYIGRHAFFGKPCAHPLPIPVNPRDLTRFVGAAPIDISASSKVEWDSHGWFVLTPPGTHSRLYLDPTTSLPMRIDMLDSQGTVRATARLSRHAPVPADSSIAAETLAAIGAGDKGESIPKIATRIEVELTDGSGRATLFLSDLSQGKADGKISEKVFELDKLLKVLKPTRVDSLDHDCM